PKTAIMGVVAKPPISIASLPTDATRPRPLGGIDGGRPATAATARQSTRPCGAAGATQATIHIAATGSSLAAISAGPGAWSSVRVVPGTSSTSAKTAASTGHEEAVWSVAASAMAAAAFEGGCMAWLIQSGQQDED
ncbi:hypothetical protein, partial [Bosea sp. LC85]|uniref:hypothetical protein n=1 Tax=Bosea sp. LC85 TaxID=1502851 RepID=UPI0005BA5B42